MQIIKFILLYAVTMLLVGCAVFSDLQEPAPVYGSGVKVQNKISVPAKLKKTKKSKTKVVEPKVLEPLVPEVVEVQALGDSNSSGPRIEALAPEPLTPEQQAVAAEQIGLVPNQPKDPVSVLENAHQIAPPPVFISNINGAVAIEQKEELPAPVESTFEPLEIFAPLSPAVSVLASSATQNSQSGNYDTAATIIERAIRIEPRNATLYYKLALLKLKSSKPREAEDLAKKAALLAANDTVIKKHSWLLIAKSREVQGNVEGAKDARKKASGF